jgi:methionyl-tRNA synthetase
LKFVAAKYDGVVPDGGDEPGPISPNDSTDADFISDVNALLKEYVDAMELTKIRQGLHTVMSISARGNLYLQSSGLGNALFAENPKRCAQVLSRAVNLIYILSALVYPFMPATSDSMLEQLNAPPRVVPSVFSIDILPEHKLGQPVHLFKKIEESQAEVFRQRFAGLDAVASAAPAQESTAGVSKRKAAALAKKQAASKSEESGPKSPELLAAEGKVLEQGNVVRGLKAQPKSEEVDKQIAAAVVELNRLKVEAAAVANK